MQLLTSAVPSGGQTPGPRCGGGGRPEHSAPWRQPGGQQELPGWRRGIGARAAVHCPGSWSSPSCSAGPLGPGVGSQVLLPSRRSTWVGTLPFHLGFPRSSVSKESACSAGDPGSIPGSGRSPGEGNSNPLQDSCLENPMNEGAWQAAVHRVTKSQTRLKQLTLCNPTDCSPPGSSVHGILQARILEWVAISFSRESSQPKDRTCIS